MLFVFVFLVNLELFFAQELPCKFIQAYGEMLSKRVNIITPDGRKYHARFCRLNKLLYSLKDLFSDYAVGESFFLFFDYIGPAHLYMSIYTSLGMDMFNEVFDKLRVKDLRKDSAFETIYLSDSCEESSGILSSII